MKVKARIRAGLSQVRPDHALALALALARLSSALLSSCIINETVWQGSTAPDSGPLSLLKR